MTSEKIGFRSQDSGNSKSLFIFRDPFLYFFERVGWVPSFAVGVQAIGAIEAKAVDHGNQRNLVVDILLIVRFFLPIGFVYNPHYAFKYSAELANGSTGILIDHGIQGRGIQHAFDITFYVIDCFHFRFSIFILDA